MGLVGTLVEALVWDFLALEKLAPFSILSSSHSQALAWSFCLLQDLHHCVLINYLVSPFLQVSDAPSHSVVRPNLASL